MSTGGATLQNQNNELIRCVEDLKEKREEVNKHILKEEEEKARCKEKIDELKKRLDMLTESLNKKYESRNKYDKTIQETENAYMKILESSQTLLTVLKKESVGLNKKKQANQ